MTISERIARNAKAICKNSKIHISDIEKSIGVHVGFFSRVRGKRMIPVDIGYAVADALGMTMEDLIRYDSMKAERQKRIAELKAELAELEGEN